MLPVFPSAALLQRELRTTLRGWVSFFALVAVLGLMCFFVYALIPENRTLNAAGQFSRQAVYTITVGLAIASFLFVSPIAAMAIAGERERDTFTLLHLTLVRPHALILAKFLNAAGFFLLLSAAILPVLGVVFFFVGMDIQELTHRYVLVLSFAMFCCAVGIACSSRSFRGSAAIVQTYIVTVIITVALHLWYPVSAYVYLVYTGQWKKYSSIVPFEWLTAEIGLGPGYLLVENILPGRRWGAGGVFGPWAYVFWPMVFLVLSALVLLVALKNVHRYRPAKRKPDPRPVDDIATLRARRRQFPYYLVDPLKRKKPIPDHLNPMFAREINWGFLGKGTRMIRVFYVAFTIQFLVSAFLLTGEIDNWANGAMAGMTIDMVMLIVVAPVLASVALTREVEQGNMDLLRTTLLTPAQILHGKMFSALISLSPVILASLIGVATYIYGAIAMGEGGRQILCGIITCALLVGMGIVVGNAASVFLKRTVHALMVSYIVLIIACGGLYFFVFLCYEMFGQQFPDIGWAYVSPIMAYLTSMDTMSYRRNSYGDVSMQSQMTPWSQSMVLFSFLTTGVYAFTSRHFARRRMRDV